MERLTSSSEYTSLTMEVTGKTSREHDISFKDSERTNVIINCDPCENEGDEQPAEGFCENCQDYLCASCFKIHRRPAVWRHHVIIDKENMPSSKATKEQLNYECTEPCSEHSTKVLEYFCQTHSQLGCPVCITTKHRMCNDVDYIPDIANQFRESTEVKETYETLQSLKDDINTYSAIVSKDKMKVKTYEKNAKEHILQLRDEFDSICNRLVDNVEHVSKCDESNIEDSLKTCEEILNKIELRQSVLEKKQAEMKVSQLFTEAKLSQLSAKEYRRELETIKECTKSRHYEIKCDIEALREMVKLTFRDQLTKPDPPCAKASSEDEYLQTDTKKLGHIHDADRDCDSNKDNGVKIIEEKWGYSESKADRDCDRNKDNGDKIIEEKWGYSKSKADRDCDRNKEYGDQEIERKWAYSESKAECGYDRNKDYDEKIIEDKWAYSESKADRDCDRNKDNGDKIIKEKWGYSESKTERRPKTQAGRRYKEKCAGDCEGSKYETDVDSYTKEKKNYKGSVDEWDFSTKKTDVDSYTKEKKIYKGSVDEWDFSTKKKLPKKDREEESQRTSEKQQKNKECRPEEKKAMKSFWW